MIDFTTFIELVGADGNVWQVTYLGKLNENAGKYCYVVRYCTTTYFVDAEGNVCDYKYKIRNKPRLVTIKGCCNVYADGTHYWHPSRSEADKNCKHNRIAVYDMERVITEGEGL